MRVLFLIKSLAHFPYVSSIINSLHVGNINVTMLFNKKASVAVDPTAVLNFSNEKKITCDWMTERGDKYRKFIFTMREAATYSNYLNRKNQSVYYKNRWRSYLPKTVAVNKPVLKQYFRFADAIEAKIPPAESVVRDIKQKSPDVVVATPANHRFSEEIEYIKAAKYLKIPSVIHTLSWDNLTTKGMFHVKPSKLLVWNATQATDAMLIHRIRNDRIAITGSPFFDKWFTLDKYFDSKFAFCQRVGLHTIAPYFVYLGSSSNIAQDETWLIDKIRERFKYISILFRPHPANYRNYLWMNKENVVVFPRRGQLVQTETDRLEFYRSLVHAKFVFGINNSAMIDAIINDKPCVSFLCDKYAQTQVQTPHFNAISQAMYTCDTFDKLVDTFKNLLDGRDNLGPARKMFIRDFIRPMGLQIPAGQIAADQIKATVYEKEN